ncbi:hypothetical protein YC2023_116723 [Brassica napus]
MVISQIIARQVPGLMYVLTCIAVYSTTGTTTADAFKQYSARLAFCQSRCCTSWKYHAVAGSDVCICITPDVLDLEVGRTAVMIEMKIMFKSYGSSHPTSAYCYIYVSFGVVLGWEKSKQIDGSDNWYQHRFVAKKVFNGKVKSYIPDFKLAFEHFSLARNRPIRLIFTQFTLVITTRGVAA